MQKFASELFILYYQASSVSIKFFVTKGLNDKWKDNKQL